MYVCVYIRERQREREREREREKEKLKVPTKKGKCVVRDGRNSAVKEPRSKKALQGVEE